MMWQSLGAGAELTSCLTRERERLVSLREQTQLFLHLIYLESRMILGDGVAAGCGRRRRRFC